MTPNYYPIIYSQCPASYLQAAQAEDTSKPVSGRLPPFVFKCNEFELPEIYPTSLKKRQDGGQMENDVRYWVLNVDRKAANLALERSNFLNRTLLDRQVPPKAAAGMMSRDNLTDEGFKILNRMRTKRLRAPPKADAGTTSLDNFTLEDCNILNRILIERLQAPQKAAAGMIFRDCDFGTRAKDMTPSFVGAWTPKRNHGSRSSSNAVVISSKRVSPSRTYRFSPSGR